MFATATSAAARAIAPLGPVGVSRILAMPSTYYVLCLSVMPNGRRTFTACVQSVYAGQSGRDACAAVQSAAYRLGAQSAVCRVLSVRMVRARFAYLLSLMA